MKFKSLFLVLGLLFILEACTIFRPRIPYQMGMSESKFLRQNRKAVISQLDNGRKVYRLITDERFYMLATFEDGVLTNLEEREITPLWQQQRMMDSNNPN
ncbi:MAG TPA: hypothetical protein VK957_10125 [Lunatimonas sp.]|nr:hypothetical protein [Lunatimonas sp.]